MQESVVAAQILQVLQWLPENSCKY